ncbi:MAG: hypothetical protein U1F49_12320 [Rubrivivax sp.]
MARLLRRVEEVFVDDAEHTHAARRRRDAALARLETTAAIGWLITAVGPPPCATRTLPIAMECLAIALNVGPTGWG